MVAIGDLVVSPDTWNPDRANGDATFTYIDLSAVDQSSKAISAPRQILARQAPSRARQVVANRDVLVSTVRPNLNAVAVVPRSLDQAIASTGFCVLRPQPERLDSRYLFHWVKTPGFVSGMVRRATGANYPAVSDRIVRSAEIPLPPLAEQRRIADILDQADELRAKRRAGVALINEMRQSMFISRFGDPRPGKNKSTAQSPIRRMGDLVRIRTGKLDANAADADGKYPFFTCGIRTLRINTFAFDCKAVLVAGNGDLNVKYYEGAFNAYQRTYVIESLNEGTLNPRFAYAFLDIYVSELREQAIGGVIKYIKLPYLTGALIPLPTQKVQEEFVASMDALGEILDRQTTSGKSMDSLFAALQNRAFRGEL